MASANPIDDRFEVRTPAKAWDSRISLGFNAALFGFQAVKGIGPFLVSDRAKGPPVGIFISVVLDALWVLMLAAVAALFVQVFWRRFLASVAAIRPIDYQEALAIVLMLGLLFGR